MSDDGLAEYHTYVRDLEDRVIASEALVLDLIGQLCDIHRRLGSFVTYVSNSRADFGVAPFGSRDVSGLLQQLETVSRRGGKCCGSQAESGCCGGCANGGFPSVEVPHE